jgi:hypothetical protein
VNAGTGPWPGLAAADEGLVTMAVTWQPAERPDAAATSAQTVRLARDLPPGASEPLRFWLVPPPAGVYRLTLALRQNGQAFPADVAPPLVRTVTVIGPG